MEGGTLFETIERRRHLTEQEASLVIRDIATALQFLHQKGEHSIIIIIILITPEIQINALYSKTYAIYKRN